MKNVRNFTLSPDSTVFFATFSLWSNGKRMPTNGSVEPLRDFLLPRVKKLVLLDQLVPGEEDISYKIEEYNDGNKKYISHKMGWWYGILSPFLRLTNSNATQVPFKIRDFLSVIDWAFRDSTRFDYFIGLESVNAIAGILLRFIGRVKTVVYYVSDYSPNRYANKLFNRVYLVLDRFAAMHSDYIWDVSKAMQPARISAGLNAVRSAPVIHVPNGLLATQIQSLKITKIKKHALVYMGTLGEENGPDLIIRAMQKIRKAIPTATLRIIGGGERLPVLQSLVAELHLEKNIKFYGYVPDGAKMASLLRECALGVAPYRSFPGSIRFYADAGKIRAYCAAGLPVISSKVPPLGKEVAEYGGALVVNDTIREFSNAVISLLSDRKRYIQMRSRAYDYAKNATWERTFANAFFIMSNYAA
ncbi:MAG: glycosyltransferase [Patescibacteria group bacterium]